MRKILFALAISICVILNAQVPSYVPTNGLNSWWSFTGNANDMSGNGNNGVVSGATLIADRFGNSNSAYNFTGSSNIIANLSTAITGDWSISSWYYKTGTSSFGAEYFLSFGNLREGNGMGFGGSFNGCDTNQSCLYDGNGTSGCFVGDVLIGSMNYSQWTNLVIVKSGNIYSLYSNGVLSASGTLLSTIIIPQLFVGMRADNSFYFNGYVDDIGIWNRALDSAEIIGIYNPVPICGTNFTYTTGINGQVNFGNNSLGIYNSWSFGDNSTSNSLNPSHTYSNNGIYTVQENVTDSLNNILCSSIQTISITNAACNVAVPSVNYIIIADLIPHWWDIYVNYSSQVVNATWYWGDGSNSVGLYPSHAYDSAGVYNICITVFNTCGDSTRYCQNDSIFRLNSQNNINSLMTHVNVINNNAAGINKIAISNQINLYPNPSNGSFTIETAIGKTLQIFDMNGRVVLSQSIIGKTIIDASNLNEGIYNLSVVSAEGVVNKKLVIVK